MLICEKKKKKKHQAAVSLEYSTFISTLINVLLKAPVLAKSEPCEDLVFFFPSQVDVMMHAWTSTAVCFANLDFLNHIIFQFYSYVDPISDWLLMDPSLFLGMWLHTCRSNVQAAPHACLTACMHWFWTAAYLSSIHFLYTGPPDQWTGLTFGPW